MLRECNRGIVVRRSDSGRKCDRSKPLYYEIAVFVLGGGSVYLVACRNEKLGVEIIYYFVYGILPKSAVLFGAELRISNEYELKFIISVGFEILNWRINSF